MLVSVAAFSSHFSSNFLRFSVLAYVIQTYILYIEIDRICAPARSHKARPARYRFFLWILNGYLLRLSGELHFVSVDGLFVRFICWCSRVSTRHSVNNKHSRPTTVTTGTTATTTKTTTNDGGPALVLAAGSPSAVDSNESSIGLLIPFFHLSHPDLHEPLS